MANLPQSDRVQLGDVVQKHIRRNSGSRAQGSNREGSNKDQQTRNNVMILPAGMNGRHGFKFRNEENMNPKEILSNKNGRKEDRIDLLDRKKTGRPNIIQPPTNGKSLTNHLKDIIVVK